MRSEIDRFYASIPPEGKRSQSSLIEFFVYFLCVDSAKDSATPADVETCFRECDLEVPKNVSARLNEGVKSRPAKYLKTQTGYKLQRHSREALSAKLGASTAARTAEVSLRKLESKLTDGPSSKFLAEAIDCLEIGAYRAAIVMGWILTVDHLIAYIVANGLPEFNEVLAKNTDRRVRVSKIENRDDFGDIPEKKLIEFSRSASLISNDVRKVLEQKLDVRNSAAHPSTVSFSRVKAVDFLEDLIENVILKYPL